MLKNTYSGSMRSVEVTISMNIHFVRKIRACFVALCVLFTWPVFMAYAEQPQELVFLTWSEYMDPELIEKFEARYNARVRFSYFESDELRDEMLVNTDGVGYDVICSNGRTIKYYAQRGWLAPISEQDVPNKRYIESRWGEAFPQAKEYAVPFFWGTMGIAYRADLVEQPIKRWSQLLDPAPELQGKIVLVKDTADLMAMALKSLQQSVNTTDLKMLAQAEQLLLAQKPHVKSYSYVSLGEDSALVKGDAVAALVYSGDALMLAEHDENIVYVVPEEGTSIWVDYLLVSEASKQKKLAMDFINFLNEPENAAQLAEFVYYATPNRAANKLLPEEFLSDPVIYPDQAFIDKSDFYRELPPRVMKRYNSIMSQIIAD